MVWFYAHTDNFALIISLVNDVNRFSIKQYIKKITTRDLHKHFFFTFNSEYPIFCALLGRLLNKFICSLFIASSFFEPKQRICKFLINGDLSVIAYYSIFSLFLLSLLYDIQIRMSNHLKIHKSGKNKHNDAYSVRLI